jgi:hypothetical protein
MGIFGGIDEPRRAVSLTSTRGASSHEPTRRPARSTALGIGTVACPRCDAPIATGPAPRAITDRLRCPFCHNAGPVRDFLSLATPSRPARVVVRLGLPSRVR